MGQLLQPTEVAHETADAPVVRSLGLMAEYSIGQAETGEWFAIGSVRSISAARYHPAWVIVGTGSSANDAVAALQLQLDGEARHVTARS